MNNTVRNLKKKFFDIFIKYSCYLILIFISTDSFGDLQNEKLWLDLNSNGNLFNNKKILYWVDEQLRLINHANYYEHNNLQGGLGYQFLDNLSLWGGYQWNSKNQFTGSAAENRTWQQAIWDVVNNQQVYFSTRTRLEQRERTDQTQWANRLRERLTLKFPHKIAQKFTPVIFDELFFNLNKPHWTSDHTFSQNRAFVGIDIPAGKKNFFEIGYLNQYLIQNKENEIDHILYLSFSINT